MRSPTAMKSSPFFHNKTNPSAKKGRKMSAIAIDKDLDLFFSLQNIYM